MAANRAAALPTASPVEDLVLDGLRTAAQEDATYMAQLECVTRGFPTNRDNLNPALLPFWKERDQLYHDGELVLLGLCIVIPFALRLDDLARLHGNHRGVEATKRPALQTLWWLGINSDITNVVRAGALNI